MKRIKKSILKRNKVLLMLLTSFSITSLGFSSWAINGFGNLKDGLDVTSGSIFSLDQYIYFDGKEDLTKFTANGFLGDTSNVGLLKIPFQINTQGNRLSNYFSFGTVSFNITINSEISTISNFFTLFSCNNSTLKYSSSSNAYDNNSFEYSKLATETSKENEKARSFLFQIDNFELIDESYVAFQFETELIFSESNNFQNDFFSKLENDQKIKLNMTIGASV